MIIAWKAYYADGNVYENSVSELAWMALPREGLVILDLYEDKEYAPGYNYRVRCQNDWYGYGNGEFISFDNNEDSVENYPGYYWINGQLVDDAEMAVITKRAERG